jgi:peptidyl-prolyl cis-trans isomerase SurA
LAKANSGGPTATQGGDLGMYKRGALAKVLEDQTFNLKAGEWTAPIRTRQGFVILKVTDHVAPGVAPLKDVEQQVQEGMYAEAMQPALRAYLTKLREDAYIDIRAGYVDSGASPKETKPVFTAYAPPAVKKKTVQQKKRFDRGTKFSTATKSTSAPLAAPAAAVTTAATTSTVPTTTATATAAAKPQKPQKVKREKVRFGQAPRNTLPAGPQETASGSDVGAGAASAAVTPGGTMASSAAPGTAIAPLEGSTQASSSSNTDPNPLEAHAAVEGKTRYSARAKQVSAEKKTAKLKKVNEKVAATPVAVSAEEKAAEKTQAAPMGLNGDTSKKKKKQPKDKNAPKERLQNKAPAPPAPPPDETPSKAPNRATPLEGTVPPAPKAPDTTVPPATAPGTPPTAPPQL